MISFKNSFKRMSKMHLFQKLKKSAKKPKDSTCFASMTNVIRLKNKRIKNWNKKLYLHSKSRRKGQLRTLKESSKENVANPTFEIIYRFITKKIWANFEMKCSGINKPRQLTFRKRALRRAILKCFDWEKITLKSRWCHMDIRFFPRSEKWMDWRKTK